MQYDAELFFEAPTKLGMMIDDTLRLVCVYMLLLREDFSVNKFGNVQGPTFGLVKVQLARPYLRTLYVILPIHLNFPIRSRCVLKTVIHRTNTVLCFTVTWESFFFFKKTFYIVHAFDIWLFFPFYHCFYFSCFFIYHLSIIFTIPRFIATQCSFSIFVRDFSIYHCQ